MRHSERAEAPSLLEALRECISVWVLATTGHPVRNCLTVGVEGSAIPLMVMVPYLSSGHLEPHVEEMRELYALKCRTLCDSLEEHCSSYVRFTRPEGGFFLWLECIDAPASEVRTAAAEVGLMLASGSSFFHDPQKARDRYLRLAFSSASVEQLREVGPRLATAFSKVGG